MAGPYTPTSPPDPERLVYTGTMGAPGIGDCFHDPVTDKTWIKLGTTWYDPEEMPAGEPPWVLRPEDVI